MRGLGLGGAQNAETTRRRRWVFWKPKLHETRKYTSVMQKKLCRVTLGSLRIPSHGPYTGNPKVEGTADLGLLCHLYLLWNRVKLFISQAEIMLRNHLMLWRSMEMSTTLLWRGALLGSSGGTLEQGPMARSKWAPELRLEPLLPHHRCLM